ncbi:MAG TPA: cytochrome c peroxidase [Rubrivivax sp.]
MKARVVALLAACATWAAATSPAPEFSPAELRRVQQLGPWPPPAAQDPGNAQAGRPEVIALGQRLFFDPRLSPDGRFACASCHAPAQAFADGLARAQGRETLARNTPSLWNAVHERWYGWDGAFDSLWSQALQPLLDQREMGASAAHVVATIRADAELGCAYRRVFGSAPGDEEATLVNAAKALGAFVGSLVSGRTPFDDFRDALARNDAHAAERYPADARRGLRIFVGRGQCNVCHAGPMFSNGEFGDTGLPHFVRPGVVDPGRHGGINILRASPHNLLSRWSDAPADSAAAVKTRHVQLQPRNFGEFKVPSLRNVALTAPYMHDGQIATLAGVVRHYSEINLERLHTDGEQILKPLQLSSDESADLLAFLQSLSDPRAAQWTAPEAVACVAPQGAARR